MTGTLSMGMLIHGNGHWLGHDLTGLADEALSAHEERKYREAIVGAGACLEGLLRRMLDRWGVGCEAQATLGPLIGSARRSGHAPEELIERLNEAGTIRNRASHKKPPLLGLTEGDSLHMLHILCSVVDWCRESLGHEETDTPAGLLPIFLSVGGPHRLEQARFLRHLRAELRRLGAELRTLTPDQYSPDKPFDQIAALMAACRAALVVGLERSHAYTVFERERSDRERLFQDQYIPTAWNQIEGAMASALRLEVLVLREHRLAREGIFEAENHRHRVRDFDLSVESRGLTPDLGDYLAGWVRHLRTSAAHGPGVAGPGPARTGDGRGGAAGRPG